MTVDLSAYFNGFVKEISLDKTHLARMDRAAGTLKDLLVKEYGLPPSDVFLQGSYANRTVIEPVEGGEYDIDMVAVCVDQNVASDVALDDLERRLTADGRYQDRVVRKVPCVRLEYSEDEVGKFHVDVVPLRRHPDTGELMAPRRGSPWKQTAPSEYTEWCRDQGEQFTRTVKILKRWRDENQKVHNAIKSIVLQVLVAGVMPDIEDDAARIVATFRALHTQLSPLSAPPVVPNPVLLFENLAASWPIQDFFDFVKELDEAVGAMAEVESASTVADAADVWRELLGPDFPLPSPDELGLRLEDTSHAEKPSSRGWIEAPDHRCKLAITAKRSTRKGGRAMIPMKSNEPVPRNRKLQFRATVESPPDFQGRVYWQVVNTGSKAREVAGGLRGEIFEGRDLDGNLLGDGTENWERTEYAGSSHEIRALLVSGTRVVAASEYFKVPIY
ncbi:MAG: nucleotidyltransferase [Acidimicrobiaceae bacterium]|nr:nucleotidyltransferase [Acidimicrobiaceae bacterium]